METKIEENTKESEFLKKKADSLRDTLANYEETVNQKISKLQEDSNASSKTIEEIVPQIGAVNQLISSHESKTNQELSSLKSEMSSETKTLIESLKQEVDGANVANTQKINEFEKDVNSLRKDNELSFSDHNTKIMQLLSASEEQSNVFQQMSTNITGRILFIDNQAWNTRVIDI